MDYHKEQPVMQVAQAAVVVLVMVARLLLALAVLVLLIKVTPAAADIQAVMTDQAAVAVLVL